MEDSHRNLLRRNRVELCRDLDSKRATSFLYSKSIISEGDKDNIEAVKVPMEKSETLMDILPKRGPDAFKAFLEFLADKQPHLFKLLQPSVAEERSIPVDNVDTSVPRDVKPAVVESEHESEPYNFQTNPRSVSSTFITHAVGQSELVSAGVDGITVTTDTEIGGISSTSDVRMGDDQGDGNKPSRIFHPSSTQKDGIDPEYIYRMRRGMKGKAFIISNKIFKYSSGMEKYPRNGTEVDGEALKKLFDMLGFETKLYSDQGSKETLAIVDRYANADYRNSDCFMCAILTHGEEGLIYSTDGKLLLKEITSKFRTRQLLGKPKLFFFQACQGFDYMEGGDQHDGPVEPNLDEVDAPGNNQITLPLEADFLYAYSTVPGYYSWRNSVRGSWFAQAIVSVFNKYASHMDLHRMLTRVNAEVAKQKSNTNEYFSDNKKQIPSIISQLRKELYFFPENVVGNDEVTSTPLKKKDKTCSVS